MDNRKLDPNEDLPLCDICCASMVTLETLPPEAGSGRAQIMTTVKFACGSTWTSKRKACYRSTPETFPDGKFTPWEGSSQMDFIEGETCPNAARMLRKAREE